MMPVAFAFHKKRVEEILDCIRGNRPIQPGPKGWQSRYELVMAAGALGAAHLADYPVHVPRSEHAEYREAQGNMLSYDTLAAIDLARYLTLRIREGTYDAEYLPEIFALVSGATHFQYQIDRRQGFKKTDTV